MMEKETRCLFAITSLIEIGDAKNIVEMMYQKDIKSKHAITLLEDAMFDTKQEAIDKINEKGYLYAIILDVYMTFPVDQWEEYDSKKEKLEIDATNKTD